MAIIVAVIVALGLSADYLAGKVPFAYEEAVVARYAELLPEPHPSDEYLQTIVDRVAVAMELPEDVRVTAHYVDSGEFNAYATLGGHVVVFGGLASALPHENALAMLLAHEMSHVKQRHPIRSLGRSVVVMLALSALLGAEDSEFALDLAGDVGGLALLTFSRVQEREADRDALAAVQAVYGHTRGALALYESLLEAPGGEGEPSFAFFSTHPLTRERMSELNALVEANGWRREGDVTPLRSPF